jgi:hypothetical protein
MSLIYLVSGSVFFVGISQMPSRPSVVIQPGQNPEQVSKTVDDQYNKEFMTSRSFIYIICGAAGIFFNTMGVVLIHCFRPPQAIAPVRVPTMPREVVIHELDPQPLPQPLPQPVSLPIITVSASQSRAAVSPEPQNWIEKAYRDNRPQRPGNGTAYPHLI